MRKLTIAISGLPGSGNSTAGKTLAEKLSLEYFSVGQMVKEICRGTHKSQKYYAELKKLCDNASLEIPNMHSENDSEAAHKFWNTPFGRSAEFNNILDNLQARLGEQGGIVIDGKLALYMVKSANYRFWITADLETRAKRNAEKEKISVETARKILVERQENERNGLKNVYGLDIWEQEKLADLVVDTSNLVPEQVIGQLWSYLNNKI